MPLISRNYPPSNEPSPYALGPVVAAFRFKNDVVVARRATGRQGPPQGRKKRPIHRFSNRSIRNLCFVVSNADTRWLSMAVVTYPNQFPTDGKLVKCHLNKLLTWFRYHWPNLTYLWWLEFQDRGAPHIHILTNIKLRGCKDVRMATRKRLAKAWDKIVDSGDPHHLVAGTSWDNERKPNGLAHYAVWYAAKKRQKIVPEGYRNVGRFWGKSRNVTCTFQDSWALDEGELRHRLRDWGYLPPPRKALWKVLYNASAAIDAT